MKLLRATTDLLRINIATACDLRITRSVLIADSAGPPAIKAIPDLGPLAAQTGTGNVTVVDTSGGTSGDNWNVKELSIYNAHATQSSVVRVEHFDGTNVAIQWNGTIAAGESLILLENGLWIRMTAGGIIMESSFVGPVDVQAFTSTGAGTWTKPTSFTPKAVVVVAFGAGGGGGAGASLATAVVAKAALEAGAAHTRGRSTKRPTSVRLRT